MTTTAVLTLVETLLRIFTQYGFPAVESVIDKLKEEEDLDSFTPEELAAKIRAIPDVDVDAEFQAGVDSVDEFPV